LEKDVCVNTTSDVIRQYESWAYGYDDDKVEIIRRDVGIELEEFVDRILDHCQLNAGQKVLDVGTGTGLIAVSIAKRLSGDCEVLGIDVSDAMLEKAKIRIEAEKVKKSVVVKKASALDIPTGNGVYDLVVCVFAIRHIDIRRALKEFARVLKPGGRTVVVDLYAPQKWRSLPARIFLPLFRVFFLFAGKNVKAERRSTLLTVGEWKALIEEMQGLAIEVEEFPNIDEPDWKQGKVIVACNRG
jgi:ubiquinone/menaquinone biosynthesis C-methylase UbiE